MAIDVTDGPCLQLMDESLNPINVRISPAPGALLAGVVGPAIYHVPERPLGRDDSSLEGMSSSSPSSRALPGKGT